ncbi:MAG: hypothetical protein ACUVTQ_09170 [Desulfotomaculales bacterium]
MAKPLREGTSYTQREVIDLLVEFSAFKDRVTKKFKEIAREFDGKPNEHELWVNIYLISSDYAEEAAKKIPKQELPKVS